jgi:conjugal transfer/entry exclusion protein
MRNGIFKGALFLVLSWGLCATAGAQSLVVTDLTNLQQNIQQVLGQARQLAATAEQIRQMQLQVEMTARALKMHDPRTFDGVQTVLAYGTASLRCITEGINGLDYSARAADDTFTRLSGAPGKTERAGVAAAGWLEQVRMAAQGAARAQACAREAASVTRQAQAILASSAASDGMVRQLQSVNQMLGILQAQTGAVFDSLFAANRLAADVAAAAAAEKAAAAELERRRLDDYTKRGAPVPVRSSF